MYLWNGRADAMGRWLLVPASKTDWTMAGYRFREAADRGLIVFWILVLLFLGLFYGNDRPAKPARVRPGSRSSAPSCLLDG